jgi:acetyl-CoA C-acetyltransferase
MQDAVILSAVRTPTGKFLGGLQDLSATELGALVVREAVARAGIDPASVEECVMGNVVSAGVGQAPARQAALRGGLSDHVAALTINKVCGSGLKAVMLAAQGIAAGDIEIAVAGGMESMSNTPYLLQGARDGLRLGHRELLDSMIVDGLWCSFEQCHMGTAGEVVATEYHIGRGQQDEYAAESHRRAAEAQAAGRFKAEMLPVAVPQRRAGSGQARPAGPAIVDTDESVRADTTVETLGVLKPAFRKDGTVTPANSSSISDGAAAMVLMRLSHAEKRGVTPLARIAGYATHSQEPQWFTTAPVGAIRKLFDRTGWSAQSADLYEINEAFAVVAMAAMHDLELAHEKVNVHGGACALGHPLGASGARIMVTLLAALEHYGLKRGIAALCIGGGEATAIALERIG